MRSSSALSALAFAVFHLLGPAAPAAHAESAAAPYVFITNVSVKEGDSGTTKFTAEVRLMSWFGSVRVQVAAAGGDADARDFTFAPAVLTLAPGGPAQTVSGEIVGDLDPEGDEHFNLHVTAVPEAGSPHRYVSANGGRVDILDDDSARASRLHIEGRQLLEGAAVTTVELRVRLEPATAQVVAVAYATVPGNATLEGFDYRPVKGTLTFAPGEVLKTILVDVHGDAVWEPDERFTVVLSDARRALVGTAAAEIVIVNDDPPSVVTIDDVHVPEGNTGVKTVTLTLRFDTPAPPSVKVHVNVTGGSAVADEDFRPKNETIYPSSGARTAMVSFDVLPDGNPECDEGVLVEYVGLHTGDDTRKTARILIVDDDGGSQGRDCPDPFIRRVPPRDAEPPLVGAGWDGGAREGGAVERDGGGDDRGRSPDAASTQDAGSSGTAGGSCSVGGQGNAGAWLAAIVLLGLLATRRRTVSKR